VSRNNITGTIPASFKDFKETLVRFDGNEMLYVSSLFANVMTSVKVRAASSAHLSLFHLGSCFKILSCTAGTLL
jgi:hypothetical protein